MRASLPPPSPPFIRPITRTVRTGSLPVVRLVGTAAILITVADQRR